MDSLPDYKPSANGNRSWLVALSLAVVTLVVYWPAVGFEFINMDDDTYVTANAHVLAGLSWAGLKWSFVSLQAGFWHPFTWLSYMLDVTVWGRGAAGFHLTNILLHTANTVLVFALLRRLTGSVWRSAVVAALFALHPLRVEAVAWVGMRKELLGTFFGLLSLVSYAGYARGSALSIQRSLFNIPGLRYGLSLFFFVCGLLSKPMVVTLPVVMLLLDYWPLKRVPSFEFRFSSWRILLLEKLPFFVVGLVVGVVTIFGDSHVVGAGSNVTVVIQHSLGMRLENAVLSYVRYLGMMFWPVNLAPLYLYPASYSFVLVGGAVVLLGIITALVWTARGLFWRVGWTWYLVTLLPVIGIIQVGPHSHADRYVYLPLIGLFIALVWGASEWLERRQVSQLAAAWVVVLILAAFTVRTRDQLGYWHDSGSLFAHTTAVTKDNYLAYELRGHYYGNKKLYDEAIESFVKSIEINPDLADTYNNLGLVVAAKGRTEEAMADYRHAIQIDPGHAGAWHNLGAALAARGRLNDAMNCYRRALELNPNQGVTLNNLGYLLVSQGKFAEAIPYYAKAIQVQPGEAGFRVNLAAALMTANRQQEGIAQYREALREDPGLTEVRDFLKAVDARR